ncbi:MAG: gfo/Idh/MocA family oxidoreductase [Spirochaetaceae bacterium]|nr:MAG: gfo/Idh/MocA family oxidoreductase [Spirochaetaceae bacterium]
MVRVCVIGLGHIGNLHASIYADDPRADLVGLCDIIPDRAKAAGERLGVPWFTDARTMLTELAPQMCSVATGGYEYSSDHYEPTMQALAAGCHVLVEKPISNELEPAARMVDAARERGLCLACDFNHRFTPAFSQAEQWIAEGELGHPLFVNMALWIGRFEDPDSEVYHLKALNPHSIDIMRRLGGEISKVQCFATKAPGRAIWSTASMNMRFDSGAVGHLTSSYDIGRGHPMERCEIAGTNGRIVIDDMWREATLYPASTLQKRVYTNPVFGGYGGFDDTFRARIRAFVAQIDDGVAPDQINGSGADALAGLRVIMAAIRSLQTGEIVDVARFATEPPK